MNLPSLSYRILDKALIVGFRLFGKDSISLTRVYPRRDLQEIGTKYGGWVIPTQLLDSNSVCYCVGCGEDISFDLGLIDQFGCDIYAFDPTPRAIQYVNKVAADNTKYHFFALGLWDREGILDFFVPRNPTHVSHSLVNLQKTEDCIKVNVDRLSSIMAQNQHQKLDLLKLDIEGAEYKVINSIIEDRIDIEIICVEYDECFNPLDRHYKERVRESVNKLVSAGYKLVCIQSKGNYTFVKSR
jgi:FkbM family methyltransferase